ncbi:exocyst complex component Sec10-domain-containing protein [Mycotypha africana]|uniref:exocyst complex component Sec10-domain-containing protein n=1 Tax=Mycotypha africana TaxID=64632 RepID=UPI0023008352|nr:exocyst complex component Sec10-domain-containing protein [Mycotypha africana]KAI8988471.1 exocyst complex component Sec10-domain-containing protein [Mycotypha africana]
MAASNHSFHELSPEVKALLTIETFRENVSTTDFIERISSSVLGYSNTDATHNSTIFDPKPFIRTFESVLEELQELRLRVQQQCHELEKSTQNAEVEYKQSITDLQGAFDDVYRSYDSLESRINDVGKTAIRIGEQLETIDKERSKASESRDIIEYYMEFQDGNSERLETLRQSGDEGQLKTAIVGRRLSAIAKEIDNDPEAKLAIEKFCESFEKEILEDFDRAYEEGDPRAMAHCAKVLFEFNGGASCIQIYVNQHEFFMSNLKMDTEPVEGDLEDNPELSNPNVPPPEVDTSLVKLYDDIRITVRREAGIISSVFPQPATVMRVLLQRIFAQSIQDQIEALLTRAEGYSHLAYLRTLASTHAETKRLIENLKFYCDKEVSLKDTADVKGLVASASPDETLDRCMDDLFVPYTEGNRYIKKEVECLIELFGQIIADFLNAMQQRKLTSSRNQSVLTRTLNQISATTSNSILSPSTPTSITNHSSNRTSTRPQPMNITIVDANGFTLLSNDAVMRMLNIHAEAILRCVELEDSQQMQTTLKTIYEVLIDYMGQKYLDIALDDVLDDLSNVVKEPELVCFSVINCASSIMKLMQKHFETAILPLIINNPTMHRNILALKNSFLAKLERKINAVLQRTVRGITYWLNDILSRQKRYDFRPKEEEDAMMNMGTQPCLQSIDFITRIYQAASTSLQGKNLETFLKHIGNAFHTMLLEHFKKFYVTPTGGILVTKDIAKYQDTIKLFKIPSLDERFEMLRQLGNIFVVKPEILKSILSEGYLARLDSTVLYPYLEKRIDFKTAKLDRLLGISIDDANSMDNTTNAQTTVTADTNSTSAVARDNGQNRTQRRSLFVNDNEVLRDMMKNYSKRTDFLSTFNLS